MKSIDKCRHEVYNKKKTPKGAMEMIRLANAEDVAAMLEIYAPYVEETSISFEDKTPSMQAFAARFFEISSRFPWLVWMEAGRVAGYAYASPAMTRAAYAWDADLSIYLARDVRGHGIGAKLYGCLEAMLRDAGYHNLYALVTGSNEASRRFHERLGYEILGVLKQTGWKMGAWEDVVWYGKRLRPAEDPGGAPQAFVPENAAMMERYLKEFDDGSETV